eukprot:5563-Heterococcus_DN1.PRE.3
MGRQRSACVIAAYYCWSDKSCDVQTAVNRVQALKPKAFYKYVNFESTLQEFYATLHPELAQVQQGRQLRSRAVK